jgi:hypothetical protein
LLLQAQLAANTMKKHIHHQKVRNCNADCFDYCLFVWFQPFKPKSHKYAIEKAEAVPVASAAAQEPAMSLQAAPEPQQQHDTTYDEDFSSSGWCIGCCV